jgi:hypothetical protein
MMAETVLTDWKSRHPFKVGQVVWPKAGSLYLSATPHRPRTVSMRGESSLGLWITFEGIAYEFPVSHFTEVPPMLPVIDATDSEGAE